MSKNESPQYKSIDAISETTRGEAPDALAAQLEDLERRLESIESVLSDRVLDKERAHVEAQKQDAREKLAVGDTQTVVVEEAAAANDGTAVTHVDGIVTFIQHAEGAEQGDELQVRFTDVQQNYAHAVPLE